MGDQREHPYLTPVIQYAIDLLSIVCPFLAPTVDFAKNISEAIMCQKLYQVLAKQNAVFDEWLKISEKFSTDSKDYEKTVRQLIYTIEAINEADMLDIYANLLRSYKDGAISKDEFLRLGWVLSKAFSADLMYLNTVRERVLMKECPILKRLEQYGLVYIRESKVLYNAGVENKYMLSDLGRVLLSCGIAYENPGETGGDRK